uniref:Uncharacterized protein n=1 Tax=Anguilla anguilla TaxID=7936 RepID=A0A0E9QJK7_ANGAN
MNRNFSCFLLSHVQQLLTEALCLCCESASLLEPAHDKLHFTVTIASVMCFYSLIV